MDIINDNLLTILILLPAFGAIGLIGHQLYWKEEAHLKWVTLGFSIVNFLL